MRALRAGADLGLNQGNFDDVDGYLAYRDHPDHRAIVNQFIPPIAAQRAAVKYEY